MTKILKNPKLLFLFFWYKTFSFRRRFYQLIGSDRHSIVYPWHTELMKHIGDIKNGFFVECGGNNGITQDPTYYLEKMRGWTGIIVEPLPIYAECAKNRSNSNVYNYALVSHEFTGKNVTLLDTNLMTTVKDRIGARDWAREGERVQHIVAHEITVPAKTLDEILSNTRKHIDLLVVDVEGYELEVLKGLDVQTHKPAYILVEILKENECLRKDIETYLTDYTFVSSIGTPGNGDNLYKRNTS